MATLGMPPVGSVNVKLNPHGVRNGWCSWPINFDPIWVDECDGFAALQSETNTL